MDSGRVWGWVGGEGFYLGLRSLKMVLNKKIFSEYCKEYKLYENWKLLKFLRKRIVTRKR